MTSRWNVRRPEFRLGLMLLAVSVTKVAVAQSEGSAGVSAASGASDRANATAPKTTTDAAASAEGTAPANTDVPVATPEPPKPEPPKPEPPKPEPPKPEPPKPEPAPAAAVPLNVEILPGSAYYPERSRGIVGGSLWLTMHGLQFPYMGPETSGSGLRTAISGSIWDDTSYARITISGADNIRNQKRWLNQGRAVLRVTPSYTTKSGWFVQGQVELVAQGDQYLPSSRNMGGVDDIFVRAGKWNLFDITVGRYQGWEVYHYGMGLDLNTLERRGAELPTAKQKPPQIYGLNYFWDRPDGGAANYAAHVYFTDYLRLEVLGQIGTSGGSNSRSVRPIAVLDLGYLKVKAGWEYGVANTQIDGDKDHTAQNGFGGAVQFVVNPYIEGGVNGAIGYVDSITREGLPDLVGSTTTQSYGGFLNGRIIGPLILGVGANQTHWENLEPNGNEATPALNGKSDSATHFQGFGAVQYSFWDKLFLKFVGSYARFHYEDVLQAPMPHPFTNTEWGGRFRVMYLF